MELNRFLLLLICLTQNSNGLSIDPLVETNVGPIGGLRAIDGDYSMFMGIPYAAVDAANPFGPSIPYPKFDEVFEAYDDSAICPQTEDFNNTIVGNLDCLHLNIYVPNTANSTNRMPVLVWVYGGGFSVGFAGRFLYGPKFLVRHDIILVTINYRLGPYGFMCLDNPKVPGNQGLKDQQLALKWIKKNIEAFGGDSDKITIYGESAGGVSVDYQFIYGDQKLFDKIIMHSGSAAANEILEPDTSAPIKLADYLGYNTTDIDNALSFLATVDTNLVTASAAELDLTFWPCIEKEFDNVERFIYDYPINIKNLNATNKSVLLAYNHDESLLSYINLSAESYENMNVFYNSLRGKYNFDEENFAEMESIVRHFYIGDEDFSPAVRDELVKFQSDFNIIYPTVSNIQKYLDIGCKNIFNFVFSYNGERNFAKHRLGLLSMEGTVHGDEMGYLFDISYMNNPSANDQLVIDRITAMWANFVKYGNPTPELTDELPVQWLAVTENELNYLELDNNINIGRRHFKERMSFWDLFHRFNEQALDGYRDSDE